MEIISLLFSLLFILPIAGGGQLILLYSGSKAQLKPLEINGPTFAEVNETIPFIVTSEGLPVKDATVLFAGYEKKTDDRGIATFQVDFTGSFKVTAEKEGFKANSTLFWVFPKGNKKLPLRGFMAGAEQVGNTFTAFRMPALILFSSKYTTCMMKMETYT
jgi:hypothetical protein